MNRRVTDMTLCKPENHFFQMFTTLIVLTLLQAALLIHVNQGFTEESPLPFTPGEKLVFDLSWSNVKAGEATIEVLPVETIGGENFHHFSMTITSTGVIDLFFKVRDKVSSYISSDMEESLLFVREQKGRKKKDVTVIFDTDAGTAQYTSKKKERDPIDIEPGTLDPLSAFFYTRYMLDDTVRYLERPLCDGKKLITGKVSVVKKETITIGDKEYKAILIEPNAENISSVFDKKKGANLQIWLSDDNRRIPLKLKSKVAIGSFTAELVNASGLIDKADKTVSSEALASTKKPSPSS